MGANRTGYIATGRPGNGEKGFGFKVNASDLEGVVHDGTSETTTTLLSSISAGQRILRAEYTAGSKVECYVDGTNEGEISSGLPTGTIGDSNERVFQFKVENSDAVEMRLAAAQARVV